MTTNSRGAAAVTFPPLEAVDRPTVDTAAAAHYLNRKPHTLLCWSSRGEGPVRPRRINGRLAWSTADLRRVLGVDGVESAP
jgi:hypothetical protein